MPQETTPPTAGTNPPADTVDPREALNLKKAQIQILEGELSEVDAKLDAEFLDRIDELMTPEELEMRFEDDPRAFLQTVEEKREAFCREKLDELKGKIDTMKSEAVNEEEGLDIEDAKKQFLSAHPEADWQTLVDFFHNDLTTRQKEELNPENHLDLMEKVYAIYTKKNKPKPSETSGEIGAEEGNMPPNMNDAPASAPTGDPSPAAIDEAYRARVGFRK